MPRREQEAYIDRVLEQVRFRFDHPAIRAELAAHLEDKTADLLRRDGTDAAAAEARAVAEMGDPEALGKALDREHHPVIGWLWRLSRVGAFIAVVWLLLSFGGMLVPLPDSRERSIRENHDITREIQVDQSVRVDDQVVRIEKLLLDEENGAHLLYSTWCDRPFTDVWTLTLQTLEDDLGQVYLGGTSFTSGGWIARGSANFEAIDPGAGTLYVVYTQFDRGFRIPISLKGSGADA